MCQMKSGLILKDKIFLPDYDSHTDMLDELGIEDNEKNASSKFIRAELYPKNGDVFSPIETWIFHVDQDVLPDWYVPKYDEERMRKAVKEWADKHIHIGVVGLKILEGSNHYIKDCKDVEIYDSATVENIYGSATVKNIYGSATVKNICDSATVKYIYGSATVKYIYGSATVKYIYGSATVKNICDSATVKYIYGSATVKYIYGSATVKYIYGSATVENICDSATVKYIYDSATVKNIYGSATVKNICDSATVENICDSATVKYIYGSATVKNICDSATVKNAKGFSTIISSEYCWNKKEKIILSENATFKDCEAKTIWQSGDWKLQLVGDKNA